jgi:MipA family protein
MLVRRPVLLAYIFGSVSSVLLCNSAYADNERPWDLELGAGIAVTPRYSGASVSTSRLRLWIDAEYRTTDLGSIAVDSGSLTIDPELRWNLIDGKEVGFGPLVGYRFGRNDTNPGFTSANDGSTYLQGVPTISSTFDAGVQGHVVVLGVPVFAQARSALSGTQGTLVNVGLYLPLWPEDSFNLTLLPTATWADARQMQALYGVSAQASATTGFATYVPGSGSENAALEIVPQWKLSISLHFVGSVAYERLLGNAAHSPLVQSRNQVSILSGVTWSF